METQVKIETSVLILVLFKVRNLYKDVREGSRDRTIRRYDESRKCTAAKRSYTKKSYTLGTEIKGNNERNLYLKGKPLAINLGKRNPKHKVNPKVTKRRKRVGKGKGKLGTVERKRRESAQQENALGRFLLKEKGILTAMEFLVRPFHSLGNLI